MSTVKEWEKKQAAKQKAKKDLLKAMTPEQRDAIKNIHDKVWDVLKTVGECQDLWMSQVRDLETAAWQLENFVVYQNPGDDK